MNYFLCQNNIKQSPLAPQFVVEFESTEASGTSQTFTVVNAGLYFLAVNTKYNTSCSITPTSSNTPLYTSSNVGSCNSYILIELEANDTVDFSVSEGLMMAIRFTNATFNTLIEQKTTSVDERLVLSSPTNDSGSYFLFGSAFDTESTERDESTYSDHCTTYIFAGTYASMRAIGSISDEATLSMYGYNWGQPGVVCLQMNVTPISVPNFIVEYSTPNTETAQTFTVVNPGLYVLTSTCMRYVTDNIITINSDNSPYYSYTAHSKHVIRFVVITLNIGDTVVFETTGNSSYVGQGIYQAIRILNAEFDSAAYAIYQQDGTATYTPATNDMYFMFGGPVGISVSDTSTISSGKTRTKQYSGNTYISRLIGCYDKSATMTVYGYNGGGAALVAIKLKPLNNNVSIINSHSVIDNGQIGYSDPGSYATVSFSDLSSYKYALIRIYDTVNDTNYENFKVIRCSEIGSSLEFDLQLHTNISCELTPTSFGITHYSGSWYDIYCDIIVTNEDIF